jgi:hypothetical protein
MFSIADCEKIESRAASHERARLFPFQAANPLDKARRHPLIILKLSHRIKDYVFASGLF